MRLMRRLLLLLALLSSVGAASASAQDYTTTPNLALKLPKTGSTNWGIYVNQDFTTLDAAVGQFHGGFTLVASSSTPIFDLTKGNTQQLTMSVSVSSSTVNQPGITAGQFLYLIICQDGTGGRTFTFPSNFQTPLPTISVTPNKCSASTWVWSASFSAWINTGGSGGGGGSSTPAPPAFSIQKADSAALNLAASSISDNGVTVAVSEPVSLTNTLNVAGLGTFAGNISVGGTQLAGSASGTATLPANTGTLAELNFAETWTAGQTHNVGTLLLNPGPLTLATSASAARTATFPDNTGIVAELNLPETWTAAQAFNASTMLLNPGPITLASLGSTPRTATFPDNTGTLAELNLAETFTANQSIANGVELRFFSSNGTNWAGFKGGASTTNLVWLFPTVDSTGTQCLSSNGSLQLSWSACSAGTGTPGGANTNIQYNNAGSFGGSGNFTFNGTDTVTLGLLNTTKGIFKMTGNTSGTVTVQPQAAAGTPTITWPTTTGTVSTSGTAPLSVDAVTGAASCTTCTTNAAAATANQLLIGGGGQAIVVLGSLGTTTTVLHGNAGGAPTFAAVNLATDTSGIAAIANGGTGQATAGPAFNALAPATATGGLIIGTGANTYGNLAIGTNGLCLVSNGTTATWNSCAAGAIGGSGSASQVTFWNTSSAVTGSANWTYATVSGQSLTQGANGADAFYMKRFTDSAPTGNFLHFQNAAANADVFKVDVNGNATGASFTGSGAGPSYLDLPQTSAPALGTNSWRIYSPVSVPTASALVLPGASTTGFIRGTNSANVNTLTFAAASGIGACVNSVATATNDNAPPTCNPISGAMFGSQSANAFLGAPSGSAGNPGFRLIVSADVPAANLNGGGNGGVTGTLPVANGGSNATTASAAFNNLSPMTTAGDIIYGAASGFGTRLAAGSATQLLHSGTTPSWAAVSLTADVTGITPIANGGTNASSGMTNTNGAIYSDGTKLVSTATGGAGTLCLTSVSGATPSFASCAGSASTVWSSLTAPGADLSLAMSTFNTLFTHGIMTGTRNVMEWTDGASTSTGSILNVHTNASSTMKPFTFTAAGTANGIQMSNVGALTAIGSGAITATATSLNIATTSPITGGASPFNTNITLACATCVTSGSALTSNALVLGSGGGQGTASLANGTTKQILIAGAPPTYIDFPDYHYYPAADCVNAIGASGWSTAATPAATCRAGTNNKEGYLLWGASDTAQFSIGLPADWDTGTNPNVRLRLASTDATNGHTIIMQIATACGKGDGSVTDDVAFNAAQSLSTVTLNGNANRQWDATLSGITMTGCIAGGVLRLQLSRTTDTATNVDIYGLGITIPRLLTVAAN